MDTEKELVKKQVEIDYLKMTILAIKESNNRIISKFLELLKRKIKTNV